MSTVLKIALAVMAPADSRFGGGQGEDEAARESENKLVDSWVDAARKGDRAAFSKLVEHFRGRVYGMIYNLVRNEADALDLTQETFIKVWKALPGFEGRARFFTWMFRIAHNVTYDFIRARKSRGGPGGGDAFDESLLSAGAIESSAPTAPKNEFAPDERADRLDVQRILNLAMAELSPDHRQTLVLREAQGMKYEEIAEVMECSLGTVMSRLHYARKKMRDLLLPHFDTLRASGFGFGAMDEHEKSASN